MGTPESSFDPHPWEDAADEDFLDKRKTLESVEGTPVKILDTAFKYIEVPRDVKDYIWGGDQQTFFRFLPDAKSALHTPSLPEKLAAIFQDKHLTVSETDTTPFPGKEDEVYLGFTFEVNPDFHQRELVPWLNPAIVVNDDWIQFIEFRRETMRDILLEVDRTLRGKIRSGLASAVEIPAANRAKVLAVKDALGNRGIPDEMDTGPLGNILGMAGIPKPRGARRRKTLRKKKGGRRRRTVKR